MRAKSLQSCLTLCSVIACQAPLSMRFSRQEYKSGLPLPIPGDLPDLGTELGSPALQAGSLPWGRKTPWRRICQPTPYSCLGNPMHRGAWQATVHTVTKSWTGLKD